MDNEHICNAVGCKNRWEKSVNVTIGDVSEIQTVNFCRECLYNWFNQLTWRGR